jgi:hypothetical protein
MISPFLADPLIAPTRVSLKKNAPRIGEPNFTYPKVLRQENYAARKNFVAKNLSRVTRLKLRIQESSVKFRNKESTMRTKTAILSIANLKNEDLPTLRQAFQVLAGVEKIDFSLERSVAVLEFDPSQSHIDDFLRAALKAGFQVL